MNHFRNTMNNNKAAEYMRNCGANSCLMVERYIKDGNSKNDGVTITNMSDTQELSGTATNLDDGTYKDQVSGGTITVSGGKITSGSAPGGKISVFFTDNSGSVSATPGDSSFKTDTTTVTLNANNVTDATYTTFVPFFVDHPATSRTSDCDIADTRRYDEPDLTATHFWLRPPVDEYCNAFAPSFAEPPATSRTLPEFTFASVT